MKKTISLQLVLLVALFGSYAQCKERCLRLTNFCDSITLEKIGNFANGGWDYGCEENWTAASIMGNIKSLPELGTRPEYPVGYYISAYTVHFIFKSGQLFDLYGTDGRDIFSFQTDQPYTISDGACRSNNADTSKPSLMSSLHKTATPAPTQQVCMHFTNFCDTIVLSEGTGGFADYAYGFWDWQCQADWTNSNILGNLKKGHELTTRAAYPPHGNYATPYTSQFSFRAGHLFDLYQTNGLMGKFFTARTNEPFTITNGACSQSDVDIRKPRLTAP